ncbi:MAG: hypothetical protein WBA70_01910, partial [Thermodesulfobacteriota bacterium]
CSSLSFFLSGFDAISDLLRFFYLNKVRNNSNKDYFTILNNILTSIQIINRIELAVMDKTIVKTKDR